MAILKGNKQKNTLNGTATNDHLYGYAGNDILNGLAGNDILDGGTSADTLNGGTGNDTYIVDDAKDVIKELAGEGVDTVETSVNWTLGVNLEKLILTGNATDGMGNWLANTITGSALNNMLSGNVGNDTLGACRSYN